MGSNVRGLAFYKRDKTPWTIEEFTKILDITGSVPKFGACSPDEAIKKYVTDMKNTYIYDTGSDTNYMHSWSSQDITACEKVCYEEYFQTQKIKTYKIKEYTDESDGTK